MSEAVRRGLRTFFQGFLGSIITSGVLSAFETEGVVDWAVLEKVGVSAAAAGIIGLVSYVHNALEDTGVVRPMLKEPVH
jgi:phosphate/sulfate permease